MSRWKTILGLLVIATVAALLACGGDAASDPAAPQSQTARGLIRAVEARSLLEIEALTLEVEGGEMLTFESRGRRFVGFTPSHLREHMLQGLPLKVSFHRDGAALVIGSLAD